MTMDEQLKRGFLCATHYGNHTWKCYRTTDGIWYRRYKSMGPIALNWYPGQGSDKDKEEILNCDQCKHRLTCLVQPECNRTFESK